MGEQLLSRAALLAVMLAACYSPKVDRCLYQCGTNRGCPNNLTCNAENWCAASDVDRCDDDVDASTSGCTWHPSNIDACAKQYDEITADWSIAAGFEATLDTTGIIPPQLPPGVVGAVMDQLDPSNAPALVIAVHDFTLDGTLRVSGKNPLIILASGTVKISGAVEIAPASDLDLTCSGEKGGAANSTDGAGGGGGGSMGGFGSLGGLGGHQAGSVNLPGDSGGRGIVLSATDQMLIPLRGGCRGGSGGNLSATPGGRGGIGGGALEISARTKIIVTGKIAANGAGGSSPMSNQLGGGGGGSGGAIFLEAPEVTLTGAKVCANGGGGASSVPGDDGGVSDCVIAARGGGGSGAPDSGAPGSLGQNMPTAGTNGMDSTNPTVAHGGGGGGGGAGRIRVKGLLMAGGASISPPP